MFINKLYVFHKDVAEIARLSSEGHYNLACNKYFESTHQQPPARVHLHPNQYFQESRDILSKDEIKGKHY